jgi:hypothetical protein
MVIKGLCSVLKHSRNVSLRRFSTVIEHSPLGTGPGKISKRGESIASSNSLFNIHPEVADAIESNKPVVALESTITTHGLPYPQNLRYKFVLLVNAY